MSSVIKKLMIKSEFFLNALDFTDIILQEQSPSQNNDKKQNGFPIKTLGNDGANTVCN